MLDFELRILDTEVSLRCGALIYTYLYFSNQSLFRIFYSAEGDEPGHRDGFDSGWRQGGIRHFQYIALR